MAEYYRSEISGIHSGGHTARRSVVMLLFDGVLLGVSILTLITSILTLFSPSHAPDGWFFPVLALLAPITGILSLMLLLYWVIRWRWWRVAMMSLPLLLTILHLGLYLKVDFSSGRAQKPNRRGTVRMMSYNVRQFYGPDEESSRDSLLNWVRRSGVDVVCLQEFSPQTGEGSRELADSIMGEEYASTTGDTLTQNIIYSRYPILRSGRTCRSLKALRSIWADLLVRGDTIRLFNNHLHSTAITSDDGRFLTGEQFLQDTAREEKILSIVSRLGRSSVARAVEADSVAAAIARSPYRVIVAGDFNDVPLSYTYRTLRGELRDAFREVGSGRSYTFHGFHNLLRIDYLFFDPEIELLEYREDTVNFSDHRPIMARFALPRK